MAKRKVLKKNLTPIGRRGTISNAPGKGSTVQRTRPGERESLTGGDQFARSADIYPKAPPPRPEGVGVQQPTAMMPPLGTGIPDEPV